MKAINSANKGKAFLFMTDSFFLDLPREKARRGPNSRERPDAGK
jgi:hypothetical protein